MKAKIGIGYGAAAVAALAGIAAGDGVTYRTVVLSGQPAPGLSPLTFTAFSEPRVNEVGAVAFWARLAGTGVTEANDGSLWSDRSGTLALAYRENEPTPIASNVVFDGFPIPAFNSAGAFEFTSGLFDTTLPSMPPQQISLAIFAERGPLTTVVRENAFSLPVAPFNGAGSTAYVTTTGPTGAATLFAWSGGAPVQIVRTGDPAPGLAGWTFSFIDNPVQSPSGELVFRATVTQAGSPPPLRQSLWRTSGGPPELIAWADPAPPLPGQFVFTDFSIAPAIVSAGPSAGAVTFWASIAGSLIGPTNDAGYWRAAPGSPPVRLVGEGDAAPGVPDATYGTISREFGHSAFGEIAFNASVVGAVSPTDNTGVWVRAQDGIVRLWAREGDDAPGVTGAQLAVFGPARISHTGRVAYVAHLRGAGAPQGQNVALFADNQIGRTQLVARVGTLFDATGLGDLRPVYTLAFDHHSSESGFAQFNARGTLLFDMEFRQETQPPPTPPPPLYTSGVFAATIGCRADFDGFGGLDIFDFLAFQNAFDTQSPRADFDADGAFTVFDFLTFLNEFDTGC